jgi:hypothetical protein
MAGLFLAMAQQQHEEPNKKGNEQSGQQVHEKTALTPSHNHTQSNIPELEPRYQILLTDNERDRSCIHLFTAQVSKFLVEHFRTPARLPDIALSEDDPSLIKIHHTIIPFKSWQSFRGRLRMAIMKYANGTADGFFCHQSQQQSQAQEHTNEPTAATVEQRETRHYKQEQEEAYPIDESRETPEPRETRHLQEERGQENMNEILATTMTVEPKEQEYQQQEQEQERTSVSGTAMFSSKEITAQQQEEQNEAEVHVRVEFSVTDIADANIPSEQECYNNVGTLRTKRKRSHMFDEHRQRQAREDEVESFGPRAKKIRTPRDEDSFDQMIW